jgi:hypothetical protein
MADYVISTQDKMSEADKLAKEMGLDRIVMLHGSDVCRVGQMPEPRPRGWYFMGKERAA